MNFVLLNAEMEVRKTRWGPGIGGLSEIDGGIERILGPIPNVVERLRDQDMADIEQSKKIHRGIKIINSLITVPKGRPCPSLYL